ncbi:MAG: FGGY family carbohydrate kinase [Saprospiraceae bacterium]|nr:FGGY family carbohydrate kinase [Saprospiraceae bacterium]
MYFIGYDIGSSSIKAALINADDGKALSVVQQPTTEMAIHAEQDGWAEQDPEVWWQHVCTATRKLLHDHPDIETDLIKGIGIAYQMHGLVLVDKDGNVIRPSIIWCDSRAVDLGRTAFQRIGANRCLEHLLNSPGNFTASKLRWVRENEPDNYERIHKIMLPGDYIAFKFSGDYNTTISGLSEGILWDFKKKQVADLVLDHYQIARSLIPDIVSSVCVQSKVSTWGAKATGLAVGTTIGYRAGDQPNNAVALKALYPGEVAATGGTSGVVYGVVGEPIFDPKSRVNGFAHVPYTENNPNIGILLCINGAGIMYAWMRNQLAGQEVSYEQLEEAASQVAVGSEGLTIFPFGNGAERMFENQNLGAQIQNLQLNRHDRNHLVRAALEGIAFSFVYGMDILKEIGMDINIIRVGNDNLFQSDIFSQTISNLTGSRIEIAQTTGAIGAALAAGAGVGYYASLEDALQHLDIIRQVEPEQSSAFTSAYGIWKAQLKQLLDSKSL